METNHSIIKTKLFFALLLIIGLWNLSAPPLWWDEGWTLSVARNWVERGHYGRLLEDKLAPPGLEAAFPVTALVALSFSFFGVGIWQGRLIGVLFMIGALAVSYRLACKLYNREVGIATIIVLLLMSSQPDIHPIISGRQVIAEVPMLFYVLAGHLCFLLYFERSSWFLAWAVVFWSVALLTKLQVVPFWALSLLVPLFITLAQHRWKTAISIGSGFLGALILSRILAWGFDEFLGGQAGSVEPVQGLYDITAIVPIGFNRLFAIKVALLVLFPFLVGVSYELYQWVKRQKQAPSNDDLELIRLSLLVLAAAWFGWYLSLSSGVPRYSFPPAFISGLFVSAMLYELSNRFNFSATIVRGGKALRHLRFDRQGLGALLVTLLVAWAVPRTAMVLYRYYAVYEDKSALQTADFLNRHTAPDTLIESYESELLFLLNRRYHYPPDQIHVELGRRSLLGKEVYIEYDPLASNPDYLVVGEWTRVNGLYEPVVWNSSFRLLRVIGRYEIFERVR